MIGAEVSGKRFWETASIKEVGGKNSHSTATTTRWSFRTTGPPHCEKDVGIEEHVRSREKEKKKKELTYHSFDLLLSEIDRIAVTLDGRVLKTPAGNPLTLPKDQKHLALLIAGEWHGQKALLKSHSLPMVNTYSIESCSYQLCYFISVETLY
jgi:hypothetical protein